MLKLLCNFHADCRNCLCKQISADGTELPDNVKNTTKTVRSVSAHVHDSLVQLLQGEKISKKSRSPHDAAAYRIKGKRIATLRRMYNLLFGAKGIEDNGSTPV